MYRRREIRSDDTPLLLLFAITSFVSENKPPPAPNAAILSSRAADCLLLQKDHDIPAKAKNHELLLESSMHVSVRESRPFRNASTGER